MYTLLLYKVYITFLRYNHLIIFVIVLRCV